MRRKAFTLVELLVSISIIGILAGLVLAAMGQSAEAARKSRTEAIIRKLDAAIQQRWESYRTRRISLDIPAYLTANGIAVTPANVATYRLIALRETMRLEMPQRYADITDDATAMASAPPVVPMVLPQHSDPMVSTVALSNAYLRRLRGMTTLNNDYEAAECLYLILTSGGGEDDAIAQLRHEDTGDVNGNGLPEFIDGWGNPIRWLRWPVAFVAPMSDLQPDPAAAADVQVFCREYHDPFDPSRIDMPASASDPAVGYRLFPLIYSAGKDGIYDIGVGVNAYNTPDDYIGTNLYNDAAGASADFDNVSFTATGPADGEVSSFDNIHNHRLEVR